VGEVPSRLVETSTHPGMSSAFMASLMAVSKSAMLNFSNLDVDDGVDI
jgi:hypothetical protein